MTKDSVDKTQEEIIEEIAKALGHSGDILEEVLARLEALGREMDAARDAREYNSRVEEFNTLRREAIRRKEMLMIHREAIGVRKHRYLDIYYPIPCKRSPKPVNGHE
ncbi:MAG: hypothetical protein WAR22_03855 [Desulfomonilia bacterium]|jgi:hypothetical protein